MKARILGVVGVVCIVIAALVGYSSIGSAAQSDQSAFPVLVYGNSSSDNSACYTGAQSTPPHVFTAPHQLIVENAEGAIVGVRDLQGYDDREMTFLGGDSGLCAVTLTIQVPTSPFYTLRVDGEYFYTVDLSRFPVDITDVFQPNVSVPQINFYED